MLYYMNIFDMKSPPIQKTDHKAGYAIHSHMTKASKLDHMVLESQLCFTKSNYILLILYTKTTKKTSLSVLYVALTRV
ncbi:protein of unknown function [Petrocella atlantisensis]|uniref:Uncharacterized protein n=1 Tax=Petrocella atlantisensis TaxID=2173034 RepID=A0A3P7NYG6_9FIRM|nr:protein of unknown function [Petrocella atlantisensis]